jgi:hypothetical protein
MMYGKKGEGSGDDTQRYRLERGFPYTRGGKIVGPIPEFATLYLYSQAAGQVPDTFRQTMTSTRVRWPVPYLPETPTGE